jgi:flavin reductase (DIM6/NTAB) family NADH-FMN oxidoreductase RutF
MITDTKSNTALENISYGFHILTTKMEAGDMQTRNEPFYASGVVSWVSQCSFEPPMVTVALKNDSDLNETVQKTRHFAINTLGKADVPMIKAFADDTKVEGNRINGFAFKEGKTGSPVFESVPSYFECEVEQVHHIGGDHTLIVAKVVESKVISPDAEPLSEWETDFHYGG